MTSTGPAPAASTPASVIPEPSPTTATREPRGAMAQGRMPASSWVSMSPVLASILPPTLSQRYRPVLSLAT